MERTNAIGAPRQVYNVYGDESCHLENDGQKVMGLGAIICPMIHVSEINHRLKQLKVKHGMPAGYELKWTRAGISKMAYYADVIDLFAGYKFLRFRSFLIKKGLIDLSLVPGQTHDEWYYKMYYKMLKPIVEVDDFEYHVYVDIKDTHGYERTQELARILRLGVRDYDGRRITRVQEVRSHEVELLQLADFILGIVVYENRGEYASEAKRRIIEMFKEKVGVHDLKKCTTYRAHKFNQWIWE